MVMVFAAFCSYHFQKTLSQQSPLLDGQKDSLLVTCFPYSFRTTHTNTVRHCPRLLSLLWRLLMPNWSPHVSKSGTIRCIFFMFSRFRWPFSTFSLEEMAINHDKPSWKPSYCGVVEVSQETNHQVPGSTVHCGRLLSLLSCFLPMKLSFLKATGNAALFGTEPVKSVKTQLIQFKSIGMLAKAKQPPANAEGCRFMWYKVSRTVLLVHHIAISMKSLPQRSKLGSQNSLGGPWHVPVRSRIGSWAANRCSHLSRGNLPSTFLYHWTGRTFHGEIVYLLMTRISHCSTGQDGLVMSSFHAKSHEFNSFVTNHIQVFLSHETYPCPAYPTIMLGEKGSHWLWLIIIPMNQVGS